MQNTNRQQNKNILFNAQYCIVTWALDKVSILVFNSLSQDIDCIAAQLDLHYLFPAVNQLLMVYTSRVGKFKYVTNNQLDYSGRRELLFTKMLLNVLLKVPEASYMGCLWKVTNCSIDQILFTICANRFNQCGFLLQTIRCRKEVIITVKCFCWCTRLGPRSNGDCLMQGLCSC